MDIFLERKRDFKIVAEYALFETAGLFLIQSHFYSGSQTSLNSNRNSVELGNVLEHWCVSVMNVHSNKVILHEASKLPLRLSDTMLNLWFQTNFLKNKQLCIVGQFCHL